MNVSKFKLQTLTCNHSQSASILEIIIHTILFNRTIGIPTIPKEIESYLFDDLYYVAIDDDKTLNTVKHELIRISQIKDEDDISIILSLYYSIKKYGILGEYDEKIEFERWTIPLHYVTDKIFVEENELQQKIQDSIHLILSVEEIPVQMPNRERFSFTITNSIPKQTGIVYDMFASASRMFSTP